MSERMPRETSRELSESEAAEFVEALERIEPLLAAHLFIYENEMAPQALDDGSMVATDTKEAVFALPDKWTEVERRATAITTLEEGRAESVTWNLRIYKITRTDQEGAPGFIEMDSFSVIAENGRSGYATYQKHYLAVNPETGIDIPLPSIDLDTRLEERLRAEDDPVSRVRVLLESLDEREAIRRAMEELTGIEDERMFTPERLRDATETLRQLTAENRQENPYS